MRVHQFPKTTTLAMPVAGTITNLPATEDIRSFTLDTIQEWPGLYSGDFNIAKADNVVQANFQTTVFQQEGFRLSMDRNERMTSLENFQKKVGNALSLQPLEDPFMVRQLRETSRVNGASDLLLSLLWNDQIAAIANDIPTEEFPVLENRISSILKTDAVVLCSRLIGFSEPDTRRLAASALALKLRSIENVPPLDVIGTYAVIHPSAQTQLISINDPVLYGNQTVVSSVEEFEKNYIAFDSLARRYWKSVEEKKLYTARDKEALKQWLTIDSPELAAIFAVEGKGGTKSPIEKLDRAMEEWLATKLKIEETFQMVEGIGFLGLRCWALDGWPPVGDVMVERRSEWVAEQIAQTLGFSDQVARDHFNTWKNLGDYIIKYMALDLNTPHLLLGQAYDFDEMAVLVIPEAVSQYMAMHMEFRMKHVYGGTKLKFSQTELPLPVELVLTKRDWQKGTEIKNRLLRSPRAYDEHLRDLRIWREELDLTFLRKGIKQVESVMAGFRRHSERIMADFEEVRSALVNIERINDIDKVLYAMLDRLGSETFGEGIVEVPVDSRVTSVYAVQGEYMTGGRPVLSVRDRFRCKARAFISSAELSGLKLTSMSVWKIEMENLNNIFPGISGGCIIGGVVPKDQDTWVVELELFAGIHFHVSGVMNLPEFLPLSSRFLEPVVLGLTEDILNRIEQHFATSGIAEINFVEKIN